MTLAWRRLELWFMRDLTDAQRAALFSMMCREMPETRNQQRTEFERIVFASAAPQSRTEPASGDQP